TGVTIMASGLSAKRLELLKQAVPRLATAESADAPVVHSSTPRVHTKTNHISAWAGALWLSWGLWVVAVLTALITVGSGIQRQDGGRRDAGGRGGNRSPWPWAEM